MDEEIIGYLKSHAPAKPALFGGISVPRFEAEFWTAKQRRANPLHEVSYRACFKAQLPQLFIAKLTRPGDGVFDPFGGRGTTAVEAALSGRTPASNDVNPLSEILAAPRVDPPFAEEVQARLDEYVMRPGAEAGVDLTMFYHPDTEAEIVSLREALRARRTANVEDRVDRWVRMIATNRLTGHSPGFFSVYTLPPNQAVSAEGQSKINRRRNQSPPYRDTKRLIMKKTRQLLSKIDPAGRRRLRRAASRAVFTSNDARRVPEIPDGAVSLVVTSPPFLDVVQYARDNWLRCWFNGVDAAAVERRLAASKTVGAWEQVMFGVLQELYRVVKPGGWVAFEVGEVKGGRVKLDEHVVPLGLKAGFDCKAVMINRQAFTKTANIWGVANNRKGTNTNRIVLFRKEA